jgi:dihydrofolate reductase
MTDKHNDRQARPTSPVKDDNMALIEANISMSVDGYVTGPGVDQHPGLGEGGEALHAWIGYEEGRQLLAVIFAASGAVVTSRKVYEDTSGWDAEDGFFGMPVYVVTHQAQEPVSKGDTTFTFVTGGIEAALAQAAEAAGDKLVHIMGGASIIQQALRAGLVDRLHLHLAPILLGAGTPLFDHLVAPLQLAQLETLQTPEATHLRYRVIR